VPARGGTSTGLEGGGIKQKKKNMNGHAHSEGAKETQKGDKGQEKINDLTLSTTAGKWSEEIENRRSPYGKGERLSFCN